MKAAELIKILYDNKLVTLSGGSARIGNEFLPGFYSIPDSAIIFWFGVDDILMVSLTHGVKFETLDKIFDQLPEMVRTALMFNADLL